MEILFNILLIILFPKYYLIIREGTNVGQNFYETKLP